MTMNVCEICVLEVCLLEKDHRHCHNDQWPGLVCNVFSVSMPMVT